MELTRYKSILEVYIKNVELGVNDHLRLSVSKSTLQAVTHVIESNDVSIVCLATSINNLLAFFYCQHYSSIKYWTFGYLRIFIHKTRSYFSKFRGGDFMRILMPL